MADIAAYGMTANPDILCPTTAMICPARAIIVRLHEELDDPEIARFMPPEVAPHLNASKLFLRLCENTVVARKINCPGSPDNKLCPTREHMNQNQARTGVVTFFRNVINRIRQNGRQEN